MLQYARVQRAGDASGNRAGPGPVDLIAPAGPTAAGPDATERYKHPDVPHRRDRLAGAIRVWTLDAQDVAEVVARTARGRRALPKSNARLVWDAGVGLWAKISLSADTR